MKKSLVYFTFFLLLCAAVLYRVATSTKLREYYDAQRTMQVKDTTLWEGPTVFQMPIQTNVEGPLIKYGFELISHTSLYFGPRGSILQSTNGMNCTNCHLAAGTKPWGLNYGAVYANYPKFRPRSGTIESIYKRVNDCFERSLNGKALDSNSKEMKAIYSYLKWLGKDIQRGTIVNGAGIEKLPFLDHAADPKIGKKIYQKQCMLCHGLNGEGKKQDSGDYFLYPPVWGKQSYNKGAGMIQISKLAGFIKNNMPNGVSHQQPLLSIQEAWNVAAYINAQSRPSMNISKDWPNLKTKPIDYPSGPYIDSFSVNQHQLGPFLPIQAYYNNQKK